MSPKLNAKARSDLFTDKMLEWVCNNRTYDFTVIRRLNGLQNFGAVYFGNIPEEQPAAGDLIIRALQWAEKTDASRVYCHEDGFCVEWQDDKLDGELTLWEKP
jgi:UDP-glucose 4-epimerase